MTKFERELRQTAERLCTMERINWTMAERMESYPPDHIDRIYNELRLEIANGATFDTAHSNVRAAIQKRMKKRSE